MACTIRREKVVLRHPTDGQFELHFHSMGEVVGDHAARPAVAMHSPISWALLGLVIERPSYGYELAKRFERIYGDKLQLSSLSHAYAALSVLEDRGLIEQLPGTRSGRQPKPNYRATARGLSAYHEWLLGQVAEDRRHHQIFLLQLTALSRDPDKAISILAGYEEACLSDNAAIAIDADDDTAAGALALQARLIAEEKRLAAGARIEWARFARSQIKAFARAAAGVREGGNASDS